jgi:hypothetical protein
MIGLASLNASSKSCSRPGMTGNSACSVIIGPVSHKGIPRAPVTVPPSVHSTTFPHTVRIQTPDDVEYADGYEDSPAVETVRP